MPTLLETILQIHLLFSFSRLVEALLWVLCPVRQGVSVHDTHVVNTVCTLFPEVLDKKVTLLYCDL